MFEQGVCIHYKNVSANKVHNATKHSLCYTSLPKVNKVISVTNSNERALCKWLFPKAIFGVFHLKTNFLIAIKLFWCQSHYLLMSLNSDEMSVQKSLVLQPSNMSNENRASFWIVLIISTPLEKMVVQLWRILCQTASQTATL